MNQHSKVIEMCIDGEWHCQNEFREKFIFSPHKRRIEIEGRKNRHEDPKGKYIFDVRKCEHGYPTQFDYRMKLNPNHVEYKSETNSVTKEIPAPKSDSERKSVESVFPIHSESRQLDMFYLW